MHGAQIISCLYTYVFQLTAHRRLGGDKITHMNTYLNIKMQWHHRIRQDLADSVPDEPPNGHVRNLSV